MDCSIPGFPVLHYLPDFARTHVHWISDTIQPFHALPQLLLLSSVFPSIRVFPGSRLFTSGVQSIGASASVLPVNIQSWFPSGLTGLISLLSKGLSRVFNSTVQKHQFFSAQPSLWPNSHSYMTTGKIIALTILTFVSKIMYLLFNTLSRFVIGVLYSPW